MMNQGEWWSSRLLNDTSQLELSLLNILYEEDPVDADIERVVTKTFPAGAAGQTGRRLCSWWTIKGRMWDSVPLLLQQVTLTHISHIYYWEVVIIAVYSVW